METEITVNGIKYKAVRHKISVWYMKDNHTFIKIKEKSPEKVVEKVKEIVLKHPYGMLCPVILLNDEKELRRVGEPVHAGKELADASKWLSEVSKDEEIMRCFDPPQRSK